MSADTQPLSFEEFIANSPLWGAEAIYHPMFNNFHCRFDTRDNIWGRINGADPAITEFRLKHHEIDSQVRESLTPEVLDHITQYSEVYPLLYQAYLLMRQYAQDDSELFR